MKDNGFMEFSIKQLNKYMLNMGSQQFNYEVLRAAFDSDPRIQNIIKDFDHQMVTLKDGEVDDLENDAEQSSGDSVATMARNATDLGDNGL